MRDEGCKVALGVVDIKLYVVSLASGLAISKIIPSSQGGLCNVEAGALPSRPSAVPEGLANI